MIITLSQTHHVIYLKGKHILVYKDGGVYEFTRNAKKPPTKHLILYKYLKRFINKLCSILDSDFFYGKSKA